MMNDLISLLGGEAELTSARSDLPAASGDPGLNEMTLRELWFVSTFFIRLFFSFERALSWLAAFI
jgi:hypothetical protein